MPRGDVWCEAVGQDVTGLDAAAFDAGVHYIGPRRQKVDVLRGQMGHGRRIQ